MRQDVVFAIMSNLHNLLFCFIVYSIKSKYYFFVYISYIKNIPNHLISADTCRILKIVEIFGFTSNNNIISLTVS